MRQGRRGGDEPGSRWTLRHAGDPGNKAWQPEAWREVAAPTLNKLVGTEETERAPHNLPNPLLSPPSPPPPTINTKICQLFPGWEDLPPTRTGTRMNQIPGPESIIWHVSSKAGDRCTGA